jgi:hypothetical protein
LGPEHLLELLRYLAPRLARASRSIRTIRAVLALEPLRPIAAPECRFRRTAAAAARTTTRDSGPAAHVGIAIDPAAATATVALAIDCRVVSGATATWAAPVGLSAAGSAASLLPAPLLGDEVFRDLRLVEVLLIVDGRGQLRGSRARHAELGIPD